MNVRREHAESLLAAAAVRLEECRVNRDRYVLWAHKYGVPPDRISELSGLPTDRVAVLIGEAVL